MIYIGIDPDTQKSGVCIWNEKTKSIDYLACLNFFDLFDLLRHQNPNYLKIVIEAGWLNKSNWHGKASGSSALNTKIGERTGANFEVGKKIVEMCEYLKLNATLVKPIKTKKKADEFKRLTGYQKRTNQEMRDACMLVYGF